MKLFGGGERSPREFGRKGQGEKREEGRPQDIIDVLSLLRATETDENLLSLIANYHSIETAQETGNGTPEDNVRKQQLEASINERLKELGKDPVSFF